MNRRTLAVCFFDALRTYWPVLLAFGCAGVSVAYILYVEVKT